MFHQLDKELVVPIPTKSIFLPTVSPNGCASSQFKCHNDTTCIPDSWICDRIIDCADNSDEKYCEFTTPRPWRPDTTWRPEPEGPRSTGRRHMKESEFILVEFCSRF